MIKLSKMVKKDKKNYLNPTWGIYVLRSLHGQFSGCHFLICVLKELKCLDSKYLTRRVINSLQKPSELLISGLVNNFQKKLRNVFLRITLKRAIFQSPQKKLPELYQLRGL